MVSSCSSWVLNFLQLDPTAAIAVSACIGTRFLRFQVVHVLIAKQLIEIREEAKKVWSPVDLPPLLIKPLRGALGRVRHMYWKVSSLGFLRVSLFTHFFSFSWPWRITIAWKPSGSGASFEERSPLSPQPES